MLKYRSKTVTCNLAAKEDQQIQIRKEEHKEKQGTSEFKKDQSELPVLGVFFWEASCFALAFQMKITQMTDFINIR